MEGLLLLVIGLMIFVIVGSIRAFVAGAQITRLQEEARQLRRRLQALERGVDRPPVATVKEDEPDPEKATPPTAPPPRERKPFPTPVIAAPFEERFPSLDLDPEPEPEPKPEPEPVSDPDPAIEPEREPVPVTSRAPVPPPVRSAPSPKPAPVPAASKPEVDWGQWIEEVVGKRWMTYAGGLAIFVSVGFFVKYAIDVGWIGPGLRVGAGVTLGAGLLLLGDWLARRGTRTFGLGLIGAAGLPILYVSLFAAFQLYDLLPQWMSFGAMILVTTAGMVLSIRHDSLVVSFLALVGGLLTPSLISTGEDSRDALFAYLLLLDLGVLGIATKRQWRSLDVLAFLGTCFYFAGWFTTFYLEDPTPPIAATIAWLGAFYATFLVLPFAWHLASKTIATLERFVMGLAVAAAVFWVAYLILHPDHRHALGVVALVMAGCYAALGVLTRSRLPEDRKAVFSFLAFAMTFLTIAGPLHFRFDGITVAWSAEAVLLLGLGFAYRYLPVRLGGLVILGLAVGRLFFRHWPMHQGPFDLLATREFGIAALVCASVAGFAIVHAAFRSRAGEPDEFVRRVIGVLAGLLPLFVLHHEFGTWFSLKSDHLSVFHFRATGGAVYGIGAILFLAFGLRCRSLTVRLASVGVLAVGTAIVGSTYPGGYPALLEPFANARFAVAAGLAVAAASIGLVLSSRRPLFEGVERALGEGLALVGSLALVTAVAVDLWQLLARSSRYAALVGTSALLLVAAGIFLVAAFRRRQLPWRLASLGLLLLATGMAWASYDATRPVEFRYFLNARCGIALLVALSWIWQGERTRRSDRVFPTLTSHDGALLGFAGTVFVLLALSADLGGQRSQIGRPEALAGLAALWTAGALACLFAGLRAKEIVWRTGSLLLLIAGVVIVGILYTETTGRDRTFFLSLPYGVSFLVAAAAFVWGSRQKDEPRVGEGVRCISTLLLLLVTNRELFECLGRHQSIYAAWCGVTGLNAAAAAASAAAGHRLPSLVWRLLALLPLVIAWILGLRLFGPDMGLEFTLMANSRFLSLVTTVGVTFALGLLTLKAAERVEEGEKRVGRILLWLSVLFLFLVLSAEAWLYSKQEAANLQQARFAMQMALSVTWSVYAVALLLAGFRFRLRALRLTAIGLFAITVAKLVIIDLAAIEQEQIFRILSFFVAGVLMIGGSYLYHRVEKRLEDPSATEDGDSAGDGSA